MVISIKQLKLARTIMKNNFVIGDFTLMMENIEGEKKEIPAAMEIVNDNM